MNVAVVRRALLNLGALTVVSLAVPSAAHAHGKLTSSVPAAGAALSVAPTKIGLTFTEPSEMPFAALELTGPDGTVTLAPLQFAGPDKLVITAAISGPLVPGGYTIRWQTAGSDSHVIRGTIPFTIVAGASGIAATVPPPPQQAAPPRLGTGANVKAPGQTTEPVEARHGAVSMPQGAGFGAESPLYAAIRWFQFLGLLAVLGAIAFQLLVLGFMRREHNPDSPLLGEARDRTAQVGLYAVKALAIAALLRLYAQSFSMGGAWAILDGAMMATMLGGTVWGWGWLLQVGGVIIAAVGFSRARRAHTSSSSGWWLATLGVLMLAVTPALSGHAASVPRYTFLAITSDAIHVIGAGGWLGSLLFVVAVGIPAALRLAEEQRGPAVAALVNAFSPTALVFAGITAATGVFVAWLHVGSIPALWQTTYGRTLLLKLGILSLVAASGVYNWLIVKPTLSRVMGAHRIGQSARVELAIGALVLAVTAILVATPTPMDETAASTSATAAAVAAPK